MPISGSAKWISGFSLRVMGCGTFILHFTIVSQETETAGESIWGPDLLLVVS
jgi:hypothetical protein